MGKMIVELEWDNKNGPNWMNIDNLELCLYNKEWASHRDFIRVKELSHSDNKEPFPWAKALLEKISKKDPKAVADSLSETELYYAVIRAACISSVRQPDVEVPSMTYDDIVSNLDIIGQGA